LGWQYSEFFETNLLNKSGKDYEVWDVSTFLELDASLYDAVLLWNKRNLCMYLPAVFYE
jgi:hypothetical protein